MPWAAPWRRRWRAIGAGLTRKAEDLGWHAIIIAMAVAGLFTGVYLLFGGAFYRLLGGAGDSLAAALQIPLGGALALGWGPFPEMGIAGVAWAALIAFGASSLFLAVRLFSGRSGIRLHPVPPALQWGLFREILAVGASPASAPF